MRVFKATAISIDDFENPNGIRVVKTLYEIKTDTGVKYTTIAMFGDMADIAVEAFESNNADCLLADVEGQWIPAILDKEDGKFYLAYPPRPKKEQA